MTNAIEVHDLVKVFGQDTVLKGINRNFEAGKIHGVVQFIMPLLGKTLGNTVRVVPEFPSDSPFAPTNLQFDVYEKSYDVTQGQNNTGKMNAYLVKFDAPLKSTFYNGTCMISRTRA